MKKLILLNILIFNTIVSAQTTLKLDGQNITLDPSSTVTIDPLTGNITATSTNGNLTCAEVGNSPTLTLTANPSVVNAGGSSNLTWTVGGNAASCTKSGNWSGSFTGSQVTNGSHSQTVSNLTSNKSYTLVCTNNFGSSPSRTTSVTINGGNPNCTSQPPILGGSVDSTIRLINGAAFGDIGSAQNPAPYNGTYDEIAPGSGWPGITGQSNFNLTENKYAAMRFTTDSSNVAAFLNMIPPSNAEGPPSDGVTLSISQCPGDFTAHLGQAACLKHGGGSLAFKWSQDPASSVTSCKLEKNTTYYLNIIHSISVTNGYETSLCTEPACGGKFSHSILN